ncbi:MAG TPA: polysaccharide deacetylase family protein [Candidatus Baltobacteraceae bacterium]|jgi:peptidoglycan/xylan/chitin deacetylase (PgdA/CDA1 family)|nr:polysaccharide deacetylase family protein [Candidatus Baltobacteraceae bacterium]
MNRRTRIIAVCIACALVAYGLYRVFLHAAHIEPAIITPSMDAQQEVSPSFSGRLKRLFNERVTYADRSTRPRLIALTFDDGPYPVFTPILLSELARLRVPATFFVIGRDAEQWPQLTQRIEAGGNEVADHTYTHPNLDELSAAQTRAEILKGRDVLYGLVHDPGVREYFRPPHGRYTVATVQVAQSLGYLTVLWTDDGGDWRSVTPAALAEHLQVHATAPEIVLLHSGKMATIEMLPLVVKRFEQAGYRFVTVGQLLARVRPYELNHPAKRPV